MTGTHAGVDELDILRVQGSVLFTNFRKFCLYLRLLLCFFQIVFPVFFQTAIRVSFHPQTAKAIFHHVTDDPVRGEQLGGCRNALLGDLHVLFQQSKGCILRFCVVILVQPADDLHLTALFDVKIILVDVVDEVIDHAFLIHHRDVQQHFGVVAGLLEECGKDLVQSVALLDEEQPEQLVQRIVGFQPQDGLLLIRGEVQLGIKGGCDQIRLHLAALRGENADVGG